MVKKLPEVEKMVEKLFKKKLFRTKKGTRKWVVKVLSFKCGAFGDILVSSTCRPLLSIFFKENFEFKWLRVVF